jgi:membrane protein implicated in regulation of membrane protease activity
MGLLLGLVSVVLKTISKICKKNVVIVNVLSFIFWIVFGAIFLLMSFMFNNYSLSWVGLGGLLSGIFVIKISVDFFFDYFIRFIYNEFSLVKRKRRNGKLQTNKKV